jgi:hypothetical protein
MDVAIKLSLSGGHSWEFVCDEDDPMVMGVVSALPGATVDASLPADGLVQVESRGGERLYFSRTSLVSVAIRQMPSAPNADKAGSLPLLPPRFLLLPATLPGQAAASVLSVPDLDGLPHPPPGAQDEIDPQALPEGVVEGLVAAAARGVMALDLEPAGGTHLDMRLIRLGEGASFALPWHEGAEVLLEMLVVVTAPDGFAVRLADDGPGRHLDLAEGDVLLVPPFGQGGAIGADGPVSPSAVLLAGRLCRGERLAVS